MLPVSYKSGPAPKRNGHTLLLRRWSRTALLLLALLTILSTNTSCSKLMKRLRGKEQEETADQDASESAETPDPDAATAEDTSPPPDSPPKITQDIKEKAIARRDELLQDAPPFDRTKAMFRLVREAYGVSLRQIFPNGNYDPDAFLAYDEVVAKIDAEAEFLTNAAFPPERGKEIQDLAKRMHPLYKIGDIIETRSGVRNALIRGRLEAIQPNMIIVGGRRILLDDLNEPKPEHFQPETMKARREVFVNTKFNRPREKFYEKKRQEIGPQLLREHGYTRYKGRWVCVNHLIDRFIEPKLDELERVYRQRQKRAAQAQVKREFREKGLLPGG